MFKLFQRKPKQKIITNPYRLEISPMAEEGLQALMEDTGMSREEALKFIANTIEKETGIPVSQFEANDTD